MENIDEIKEELSNLVFSGKKEEAIQLIQDKYGATRAEAEKLLQLAIKESVSPQKLFSILKNQSQRINIGKGCKQTIFKFIAIIFGFMGIPPLLIAIGIYFYTDSQISDSDTVIGTVVELRPFQEYGEPTAYTPIITYEVNGNAFTMEAPVYTDTPEFSEGEQVELFVHTDDPNSVIINTFMQRWFMTILMGSIGGLFTLGMIVFLFLGRRNTGPVQV